MNIQGLLNVLIDGVSYGILIFLISIGLSITLGLMKFINLAHGGFAMIGGYSMVSLTTSLGIGYIPSLLLSVVVSGGIGAILEKILIRRVYKKTELQHVLFSIGLAFFLSAIFNIFYGPQQQIIDIPTLINSNLKFFSINILSYRLYIVAIGLISLGLILYLFNGTIFGAKVRASVDSRPTAESIGINVSKIFAITFSLGAAFAGLAGAIAIPALGLDPSFPFKYLVIMLMVVAIGGAGSIIGSFFASVFLGVIDALFKYLSPEIGSYIIYLILVLTMIFFPNGILKAIKK